MSPETTLSPSVRGKLSVMMFLQFFVWGAWFVTTATYLLQGLKFTGTQTAQAYSTMPWGAILAPFLVGMIADRFFPAEKVLAAMHLVGAGLLWYVSTITTPGAFFWVLLLYAFCYNPTLALVNAAGVVGGDLFTIAAALAEAVKAEGSVDLVLTGKQSVDDNSGAVFAGVAATLGWPLVTGVSKIVDISGGRVTVERLVEGGQETLSVPLPAVLSVGKEINEPRYPSFMGIRKASKANIPSTPAGIAPNSGKTQWTNVRKPEERKSKVTIIDGASAQEKAAKLADALIADKVI